MKDYSDLCKLVPQHTVVLCNELLQGGRLFNDSSAAAGLTLVRCGEDREAVLSVCQQLKASILIARQAFIEQLGSADFNRLTNFGTHVLVILEGDSSEATTKMLRLGCRGAVPTRPSPKILRRAVKAILRGELWAPRLIMSRLLLELLKVGSCMKDENALTPQEQRILELSVQGYKNSAIAAALFISTETVRWHKRRLYRKLARAGPPRYPQAEAHPQGPSIAAG